MYFGVDAAHKLARKLLTIPPNALSFYRHFIELESNLGEKVRDNSLLRQFFEEAVSAHGASDESEGIWLQYTLVSHLNMHYI